MEYSKLLLQNELDHLAKLEMEIYKKISTTCPTCGGDGFGKYLEPCNHCKGEGDFVKYIPLADYMKGEGK
jgi:RecJ-like exonuclease